MGLIFLWTALIFIALLAVMRMMGKRQIGEMQPFELVITLLIAELACAYRSLDFAGATRALRAILRAYPGAAEALCYQAEFPDGIFARVNVAPQGEDELILALSEATPLLQEGLGAPTDASLAIWIATHELVEGALEHRPASERDARPRSGRGDN